MSLNPLTALCVAELFERIHDWEHRDVVDFGTQRLRCRQALDEIVRVSRVLHPKRLQAATTAREFYAAVGYTGYVDVDLDPAAAIRHDLNTPWVGPPPQGALVVNGGTGEHVFDQANVFRLAHEACRPGGVMLHILPGPAGWLNHGFWCMHPKVFTDLAKANDYTVVSLSFGTRAGKRWPFPPSGGKGQRQAEAALAEAGKHGELVFVIAALAKTSEADFVVPYDSRYFADARGPK